MTSQLRERIYLNLTCLAFVAYLLVACDDSDDSDVKAAEDDSNVRNNSADSDAGDAEFNEVQETVTVRLDDGELMGDVIGGAVCYLKIPYAKPPVGPLRWKAPQPNDPWDGVRHETSFSSPCPQAESQQSQESTDEDCLYLNVWQPKDTPVDAPVMVWIHGGGFTTGSAADIIPLTAPEDEYYWYDGSYFAETHGIVLVTINYRLGAFGFFAHPMLAEEGSPVGNQGLLDQRAALQWVQNNIEAFGGDPDNVTIFGQSAGAGSVCMHLVSPGSRGLFHRAIGQSGGCTGSRSTDRDALNEQIASFASERGCEGEDVLECLREKPVSEIINLEPIDRTAGIETLRKSFSFGAVVDGEGGFLPEPAVALFEKGEAAKVPYILGANSEESRLYFISVETPQTEEEYEEEIKETYGEYAERVLELYPLSDFDGNPHEAMLRISTDSGMVCGTLDTARYAVNAGLSVYLYNFNIPWSILPEILGISHAAEISHVFGTPYIPEDSEPDEETRVAEVMNAFWAQFARTGDPNYEGAPVVWPRFEPDEEDNDYRIQFDPEYKVLESFRKKECQFWREYAER